jgi:hypothetical protein
VHIEIWLFPEVRTARYVRRNAEGLVSLTGTGRQSAGAGSEEKGPDEIEVSVSVSCFDDTKDVSVSISLFSSVPGTCFLRKIRYALTR